MREGALRRQGSTTGRATWAGEGARWRTRAARRAAPSVERVCGLATHNPTPEQRVAARSVLASGSSSRTATAVADVAGGRRDGRRVRVRSHSTVRYVAAAQRALQEGLQGRECATTGRRLERAHPYCGRRRERAQWRLNYDGLYNPTKELRSLRANEHYVMVRVDTPAASSTRTAIRRERANGDLKKDECLRCEKNTYAPRRAS